MTYYTHMTTTAPAIRHSEPTVLHRGMAKYYCFSCWFI